jgi:hypothetical protein
MNGIRRGGSGQRPLSGRDGGLFTARGPSPTFSRRTSGGPFGRRDLPAHSRKIGRRDKMLFLT